MLEDIFARISSKTGSIWAKRGIRAKIWKEQSYRISGEIASVDPPNAIAKALNAEIFVQYTTHRFGHFPAVKFVKTQEHVMCALIVYMS